VFALKKMDLLAVFLMKSQLVLNLVPSIFNGYQSA